ncbi:cytohesin-2-like [Bolinopsis microptera]|uniref:cytohesin-2-like n=1 Tax=Bolinopsis microptera TaxID=2820187 RepID=UPI003078DB8A
MVARSTRESYLLEQLEADKRFHSLSDEQKRAVIEVRRKKELVQRELSVIDQELSRIDQELAQFEGRHPGAAAAASAEHNRNDNTKTLDDVQGRQRFNVDPKKGIELLIAAGLLNDTPEDIASFLYKGERLHKTKIGEYLGEHKELNLMVLTKFVELFEFEKMDIVTALRNFLGKFRLPGEAQKIDRMMEEFATVYCKATGSVYSKSDTCYVLAFSIIMLNTSLHNPSVKDKLSADQFVKMNNGINDGGDLPAQLLIDAYHSIKNTPFEIPEDDTQDFTITFYNPDKRGYLVKEGGKHKSWKKRYFVLTDNCLYYFVKESDSEPKGIVPLENLKVEECKLKDRKFTLEIRSDEKFIKSAKTDSGGKMVSGNHEYYRIQASNHEEMMAWMESIRKSISKDPFYAQMQARKKNAMCKQ